jgi:Fe2+ transport system protein B
LLPAIFWQILRPFIPKDTDWEKAFASTFSLPEFCAIGNNGTEATQKMLQTLALYKNLPEATAIRMLSNDMLLDRLRPIENDNEFQRVIDEAIIEENKYLLEEKTRLQEALEEKEKLIKKEIAEKDAKIELYSKKSNDLSQGLNKLIDENEIINDKLRKSEKERVIIAEKLETAKQKTEKSLKKDFIKTIALAILLGLLVIGVYVVVLWQIDWPWLANHPKPGVMKVTSAVSLFLLTIGAVIGRWRKWIFSVLFVDVLLFFFGNL